MSDTMNPNMMEQPGQMAPAAEAELPAMGRRPGLVTFAAIMLIVFAGFQGVWAFVEFTNAAWIASVTYGSFGGYLWVWAIVDGLVALAALFAGFDIFQGGSFGQVFGIIIAALSAFRWFFYLPAAPVMGIVAIGVDVVIIYALIAHADYFARSSTSTV